MTDHAWWPEPSSADLVLGAIAVPLLSGALAGVLSPLAFGTALAAGSVPAAGGVGYAILWESPD